MCQTFVASSWNCSCLAWCLALTRRLHFQHCQVPSRWTLLSWMICSSVCVDVTLPDTSNLHLPCDNIKANLSERCNLCINLLTYTSIVRALQRQCWLWTAFFGSRHPMAAGWCSHMHFCQCRGPRSCRPHGDTSLPQPQPLLPKLAHSHKPSRIAAAATLGGLQW